MGAVKLNVVSEQSELGTSGMFINSASLIIRFRLGRGLVFAHEVS